MITIEELSRDDDISKGMRGFMITREDDDGRTIISVTVLRAENVALYDEAPDYVTLPGSVEQNHAIASMLLDLSRTLLDHRHLPAIPATTIQPPSVGG